MRIGRMVPRAQGRAQRDKSQTGLVAAGPVGGEVRASRAPALTVLPTAAGQHGPTPLSRLLIRKPALTFAQSHAHPKTLVNPQA